MEFNSFSEIKEGIKSLNIQGAESIAKYSLKAIYFSYLESYNQLPDYLSKNQFNNFILPKIKQLYETRSTEPMLRNLLKMFVYYLNNIYENKKNISKKNLKEIISQIIDTIINYVSSCDDLIYEYGSKKIKDGMVVFTHCHSSSVMGVLKKAKDDGTNFVVFNTETRPKFQGRITAKELSDYGIKVRHFVDSAARLALKNSDLFLFGADAITSEGKVINKIGSELFCEVAKRYNINNYSVTSGLKFDYDSVFGFDEPIEQRDGDEIWEDSPKNVTIDNHAFEIVEQSNMTGIISEIGVFSPNVFVNQIFSKYEWISNDLFN
ncbi:MAG: hypothetical protein ACOCP8_00465 [archaeon]